jgi:hypothetical protein
MLLVNNERRKTPLVVSFFFLALTPNLYELNPSLELDKIVVMQLNEVRD